MKETKLSARTGMLTCYRSARTARTIGTKTAIRTKMHKRKTMDIQWLALLYAIWASDKEIQQRRSDREDRCRWCAGPRGLLSLADLIPLSFAAAAMWGLIDWCCQSPGTICRQLCQEQHFWRSLYGQGLTTAQHWCLILEVLWCVKVQVRQNSKAMQLLGASLDGSDLRPVEQGTQCGSYIIIKTRNEERRLTRLAES